MKLDCRSRIFIPRNMSGIIFRDLQSVADFEAIQRLEKLVWGFDDTDVTAVTLAVATRAAGSIWVGAFDGTELIGFAFALPSLEDGRHGFHSHTLAVHPAYNSRGLGYRLKLVQRERALALGIRTMTWTFDPLRSRNAHLNFAKLGVISTSYRVDFYGPSTSSSMHANGTDRLWVTWNMDNSRVRSRLAGENARPEMLQSLAHLKPVLRFRADGSPDEDHEADISAALTRDRVAIEIPSDTAAMERDNMPVAKRWRAATRRAFSQSIEAGFTVTEFCRNAHGEQGPGVYLLQRASM
jgi:predicted GNAT superfamily acetyltransferase